MIRLDTFASRAQARMRPRLLLPQLSPLGRNRQAGLVHAGLGDRLIQAVRPRSAKCDSIGEWQVKLPVPQVYKAVSVQ